MMVITLLNDEPVIHQQDHFSIETYGDLEIHQSKNSHPPINKPQK